MLLLIMAGFVFLFAVLCFVRHGILKARGKETDYDAGGVALIVVAMLVILGAFVGSGVEWALQISDFENIKKFQQIEAIYQAKAEVLTAEFVKHLAETYPEHEKDIYDKISPDKVYLYFVKYPELRASETLVALVDRINKLQSDVYEQQINVAELLKNTRFRPRNPWIFSFMVPTE